MFKSVLYIEKKILKHSNTQKVIDRIQPRDIVLIDSYKEVLNQPNSHWFFNKQFQKIILARREGEFYYKIPVHVSSLNYRHFYYNTLALNCLYHCEYCYLQGMYNTPHLVMFLNNKDFIAATRKLIKQIKDTIYLALSYDTDLPSLEKFYPYCKEWMEFAFQEKKLIIEIRTKSNISEIIHQAEPSSNILLSFTLSPPEIQAKYEPFTPSLEQRLNAIKQAINKGFSVMLCFDPLIYISNFQEVYTSFFDKIFQSIPYSNSISASIGTFRMNKDFFKNIKRNNPSTDIYFYKYEIKNNTISYPTFIKNEMIMFVKSELLKRKITNIFIYE